MIARAVGINLDKPDKEEKTIESPPPPRHLTQAVRRHADSLYTAPMRGGAGQRELAEVKETPHLGSVRHHEIHQATDCDHEGQSPDERRPPFWL